MLNALIPHNQFFDFFFSFLSLRGNSIIIWAVIVLFLVFFELKKHHYRLIILFLISFLTTAFLVNVVIKNIIRRPRPNLQTSNFKLQTYQCPKDYSFPSGHAATAFAAATIIAHYDKKRKWFYYLVASLIGLSRIYLGCHYLSDVVGGGIIGYFISSITVNGLLKCPIFGHLNCPSFLTNKTRLIRK
jgi:undecaprenyl-diphosphatase